MSSRKLVVASMIVGLSALTTPALAHGDIQGSDPEPKSTVKRAPRSVAITFTEAPTAQAVLKVADGCKRDVGQGVDVAGATATVRTATGQPGKWEVSYRVISSLDAHQTQGRYTFTVAGDKDCTPDGEPTHSGENEDPAAPNPRAGSEDEPEGSGAPVIPIALGAAGLIAVALIVRRSGS